MLRNKYIFILLYFIKIHCAIIRPDNCSDLTEDLLTNILGPAYNHRYMSIKDPMNEFDYNTSGTKRDVNLTLSFYVDEKYEQILDEGPAWLTTNHYKLEDVEEEKRTKRMTENQSKRLWECEYKVVWMDLGPNYFPRYLKNVECIAKYCWYGQFKCKARSFAVKVLRKKRNVCANMGNPRRKEGTIGLPDNLKKVWVWEERAITFCCDCSQ